MYSSTLLVTSAFDGGGWSTPRSSHFTSTHFTGGWVNQVMHNLTTVIYRIN